MDGTKGLFARSRLIRNVAQYTTRYFSRVRPRKKPNVYDADKTLQAIDRFYNEYLCQNTIANTKCQLSLSLIRFVDEINRLNVLKTVTIPTAIQ